MRKFWRNYTFSVNRMRKARGFGIHSPFAFRLITKVIREKAHFYAYDEIATTELQHITPVLTHKQQRVRKKIHRSRRRLLFRLTHFFHPDEILEVGTAWGLSSLYLRKVSHSALLTIVEPESEVNRFAQQLFAQEGEQAEFVEQPFADCLPAYCQSHVYPYIIVNRLPASHYAQLPQLLSAALDNEAIIIIDGIRSHNAAFACWETLVSDELVKETFDTRNVGLICCNSKLNKQNYRIKL